MTELLPHRAAPKAAALALSLLLSGCAQAPLAESGALLSYADLKESDGVLTKAKIRADRPALLAAKTAALLPTRIADTIETRGLTAEQLHLVSNAIDRTLCRDLSRRFAVVDPGHAPDLVVQATITNIVKTDTTFAGASLATSAVSTVGSAVAHVPLPSLRLPFGLGSLSAEGEAITKDGHQVAAFVWARGADAFLTRPRVAAEGDAHTLASAFAADFATLLVTGRDPIRDPVPGLPTAQTVKEYLGGDAKFVACRRYGKDPGLPNTVGAAIGLPPAWTDDGAARTEAGR